MTLRRNDIVTDISTAHFVEVEAVNGAEEFFVTSKQDRVIVQVANEWDVMDADLDADTARRFGTALLAAARVVEKASA